MSGSASTGGDADVTANCRSLYLCVSATPMVFETCGLVGEAAMGGLVGPIDPRTAGPGAGKGEPEALHCAVTPLMLHACEMDRARAWLMILPGKIGALAVSSRHAQSILVLIKDLNESQQVFDGITPLLVLPVMKLAHGVKLLITEVVQGVLICP